MAPKRAGLTPQSISSSAFRTEVDGPERRERRLLQRATDDRARHLFSPMERVSLTRVSGFVPALLSEAFRYQISLQYLVNGLSQFCQIKRFYVEI